MSIPALVAKESTNAAWDMTVTMPKPPGPSPRLSQNIGCKSGECSNDDADDILAGTGKDAEIVASCLRSRLGVFLLSGTRAYSHSIVPGGLEVMS